MVSPAAPILKRMEIATCELKSVQARCHGAAPHKRRRLSVQLQALNHELAELTIELLGGCRKRIDWGSANENHSELDGL